MLEAEIKVDPGKESLHDYLLDQDAGSVTFWDTPRPPVSNRTPGEQMPNVGNSEIGQSQPLLSVAGTEMDCEKAGPSRTYSLFLQASGLAPASSKGAASPAEMPPTVTSEPVFDPVELQ